MVHIVLVEPEIPQNTGNIARTCAVTKSSLHLIRPLGFDVSASAVRRAGLDYWSQVSVNEKNLKRAGMDYWEDLDVTTYIDFNGFMEKNPGAKIYMATTKAHKVYTDVQYEPDCYLFFGKETAGLPAWFRTEYYHRCVRIPMVSGARCLNLSNAVAVGVYEALRQWDFAGLETHGQLTRYEWSEDVK